ncbi:glycoside hydrolase family 75 protein [Paraburkholderia terrae]|nr:glycoside hydrolase family 75 protein [Paraburkholderia terrae]
MARKISSCVAAYLTASTLMVGSVRGAECGMPQRASQVNLNVRAGTTPVWSDSESRFVFFQTGLHTNTDGTSRSYSVDDFWGERTALNNLCNAMSDECAGLDADGLKARRLETQRQQAAHWPNVAETRISPQIIAFDNDRKPCAPVDGYLISATALHKVKHDACSQEAYVDALKVPALVLPGRLKAAKPTTFQDKGVEVGDLVVAIGPSKQIVYGVVGDTGPATKLGEASIAMNGLLLGKVSPPVNYQEIRGRGRFQGKGWDVPKARILIFPRSRDKDQPFLTAAEIKAAAEVRFEQFGGQERLEACSRLYEGDTDQIGQRPR